MLASIVLMNMNFEREEDVEENVVDEEVVSTVETGTE